MYRRMIKKVRQLKDWMKNSENLEKASGHYWNMSSMDARVKDQSHWCGAQRWRHDRWFDYGDFYFNLALKYLQGFASQNFIHELAHKTALEWGCGGGAIVRPLCGNFAKVYGVDISQATLDECEKQMQKMGYGNFTKVCFSSQDPENVLQGVEKASVDLIISVGVFQHFPSKHYTRRVLGVMEKILEKNGYALLQVRYFDGSPKLRQKDRDYAQNVIYMTSFTVEEFADQLKDAGFSIVKRDRDIDDHPDYHDYYLVRK
jgi:2-polyprenyl-3-methyl-5-hydroxy-6-metoxy-1,4-benzoquinol methylase